MSFRFDLWKNMLESLALEFVPLQRAEDILLNGTTISISYGKLVFVVWHSSLWKMELAP